MTLTDEQLEAIREAWSGRKPVNVASATAKGDILDLLAEVDALREALREIEQATRNVNTRRSQRSKRIHEIAAAALSSPQEPER